MLKQVLCGILGVAAIVSAGCATILDEPLYLDRFSRNVVIYADGRIYVDEIRTDFRFVVRELKAKGSGNNMPVVVHVERDAKLELFDHVFTELNEAGYKSISVRSFTSSTLHDDEPVVETPAPTAPAATAPKPVTPRAASPKLPETPAVPRPEDK